MITSVMAAILTRASPPWQSAAMDVAPVVRVGDPATPYRRRIRLVRVDATTVWGGLEDDFHHFEVTLHHDGEDEGIIVHGRMAR